MSTMNEVILDQISFEFDIEELRKILHIEENGPFYEELKHLVRDAQSITRAKALYKIAYVESRGDDHVIVDGTRLTSRVLRVNLEQAHRVFPYVATCGTELEDWATSIDDMLHHYWADKIKEMALSAAMKYLEEHLSEHFGLQRMSSAMSPGSLNDWPIQEQRALFEILGNTGKTVGVQLSESYLMIPTKSVSGLHFPSEGNFVSCQLCPRENCPGRRAVYDKELYGKKYSPT